MSLNTIPLNTIAVIDPRLDYNRVKSFSTLKGASTINNQFYPAQVPIGSNMIFNCTLSGRNVAVNRKVLIHGQFDYVITGTNPNPAGNLLTEGFVAPRQYPLHSNMSSINATIAGGGVNQANVNTYINQLMLFKQRIPEEQFTELSTTPSYPDQSTSYDDTTAGNRNPLGTYQDGSAIDIPRGGFSGFTIDPQTPGNTVATAHCVFTEELYISPFLWGRGSNDDYALIGVEQMSFNINLDLSRGLSLQKNQGSTVDITSVVTSMSSATLILQFLSPQLNIPRPMSLALPYSSIIRYQTTGTTVSPGANFSIPMSNIQFNSIPRIMMIYASTADASRTSWQTDAVFCVQDPNTTAPPISMTFNNREYFTTSDPYSLYLMCVRNGLQQSWTQWSKKMGSVILIDLGAGDMGLDILQSPSLSGNYNMQVTFKGNSQFLDARPAVLNVVAIYDGVMNIVDGQVNTAQAVLNEVDIDRAKVNDSVSKFQETTSVVGGSFIGDIVSGISRTVAPMIPQQFKGIESAAKSVYCNADARKALCGEALLSGGAYSGGALMSGGAYSGGCGADGSCCGKKMTGGRRMTKAELARSLR